MLLMKKAFFDAIRRGAKRTTLRYWRSCRIKAPSVHTIPGLGSVRIESVQPLDLRDLTDADAQADGFENLRALRRALRALYPPEQREGRTLYLVRFTLVSGDGSRRKRDTTETQSLRDRKIQKPP
jgi:hypothetical protein